MLLIKNAWMIDPGTGLEGKRDIFIRDGKIVSIEDSGRWEDREETTEAEVEQYDAEGLVAAPGLIDVHVHFREPGFTYKEDIISGSRAAARGGFTTVVLMANTKPVVDNPETLAFVLERGKETDIRVKSCCAITKGLQGKELTDMSALLAAGAAGFTDDGIPLLEESVALQAMEEAARLGAVLSFQEEDPAYITNNGIHAGRASAYFGIGGSEREAEISMVERDIRLAERTGAVVNIQHISTKEAVALLRDAKKRGVRIHGEATPHHFTLTQEAVITWGTLGKMNPPLREEADRLAIIEGLQDDTIDLIATDHAPHSAEEKARSITAAPSGIIGLETALSLGISSLVRPGYLTLKELIRKMTWNPARLYGLEGGCLKEGGWADLVLFDPEESYTVDGFASKSCNSPFRGARLTGKVKCTVCDGKIVYRDSRKD